jgi:hypothetical protein
MNARRDEYAVKYSESIKHMKLIANHNPNNSFIQDMYRIMITGSRPITPKMYESIQRIIADPRNDIVKRLEMRSKIKPILERVNLLHQMVVAVDEKKSDVYRDRYSSAKFVESVKQQLETKLRLSEKQMKSLAKVYKRYKPKYDDLQSNKNSRTT